MLIVHGGHEQDKETHVSPPFVQFEEHQQDHTFHQSEGIRCFVLLLWMHVVWCNGFCSRHIARSVSETKVKACNVVELARTVLRLVCTVFARFLFFLLSNHWQNKKNLQETKKKERNLPASKREAMRPQTLALSQYKTQEPLIIIASVPLTHMP